MRINRSSILEAALLVIISVFWCEYGYYHYVFNVLCPGWPGLLASVERGSQDLVRFLVIADTHIMGPIKSFKIDKLRREWQMRQAFSISNSIFKPDIIIILGDLLDEGSFSRDDIFEEACSDFERIFAVDTENQETIIVPGNHDVGFHDHMRSFPYFLGRFRNRFKTTSAIDLVRTPKTKDLTLVVSNSMSFYNDTCMFCRTSGAALDQLAEHLHDTLRAKPILLGHIPLFRSNDANCIHPKSMHDEVHNQNIEGKDVLHQEASELLISKLRPRLALSGHTHMFCETKHEIYTENKTIGFQELTLTSYNHKYAEVKPGFLLMTANSTHAFTEPCNLIDEWVVISIYGFTFCTVLFRLILAYNDRVAAMREYVS